MPIGMKKNGMKKKQPNQRPMKQSAPAPATARTGDDVEDKVLAFAEQLGFMVGTVRAKADGWLDREALTNQIGRIRDSANELLAHVTPGASREDTATAPKPNARKAAASSDAAPAAPARVSRGPVDAPGKRHRRPPPQQRMANRMGEPRGKQMGQKSAKGGHRRGRG
jgi:hypothetical protein